MESGSAIPKATQAQLETLKTFLPVDSVNNKKVECGVVFDSASNEVICACIQTLQGYPLSSCAQIIKNAVENTRKQKPGLTIVPGSSLVGEKLLSLFESFDSHFESEKAAGNLKSDEKKTKLTGERYVRYSPNDHLTDFFKNELLPVFNDPNAPHIHNRGVFINFYDTLQKFFDSFIKIRDATRMVSILTEPMDTEKMEAEELGPSPIRNSLDSYRETDGSDWSYSRQEPMITPKHFSGVTLFVGTTQKDWSYLMKNSRGLFTHPEEEIDNRLYIVIEDQKEDAPPFYQMLRNHQFPKIPPVIHIRTGFLESASTLIKELNALKEKE